MYKSNYKNSENTNYRDVKISMSLEANGERCRKQRDLKKVNLLCRPLQITYVSYSCQILVGILCHKVNFKLDDKDVAM